ncbi:EAL and HDOD domain-containing protein [Pengzhenrongella phosphoraccumulans]|jgi:c-di-GMP phosphodiesterase|uniref:EAL and HDOD domain-containing protein n=1 Tax=Pengzhenrongella phosphoraccumulans TaxID=3114394 RepID=UPI0038902B06
MTTDVYALPTLARSTFTGSDLPAPPSQRTCDRFLRSDQMLLGRQGIFTGSGDVLGYELYFRSPHPAPLHVDFWTPEQQNHATAHVLHATFAGPGVASVAGDRRIFVNFTRSYLVDDLAVPYLPEQLVVEVVESVIADAAVIAGVRRLRERGFRIAIDDFIGLPSQRRLLPFADYVKIDVRDLDVEGQPLLDLARSCGAQLVAECVESDAMLDECQTLGFDLYQGFALEVTQVLDRTAVVPSRRCG